MQLLWKVGTTASTPVVQCHITTWSRNCIQGPHTFRLMMGVKESSRGHRRGKAEIFKERSLDFRAVLLEIIVSKPFPSGICHDNFYGPPANEEWCNIYLTYVYCVVQWCWISQGFPVPPKAFRTEDQESSHSLGERWHLVWQYYRPNIHKWCWLILKCIPLPREIHMDSQFTYIIHIHYL